jgi:hypothetical protein
LKSQTVRLNPSAKMGLRHVQFVFTQEGVALLSAVLRSDRAVRMSIAIVPTFVRMRELMTANKEIAARVWPATIAPLPSSSAGRGHRPSGARGQSHEGATAGDEAAHRIHPRRPSETRMNWISQTTAVGRRTSRRRTCRHRPLPNSQTLTAYVDRVSFVSNSTSAALKRCLNYRQSRRTGVKRDLMTLLSCCGF